MEYNSKSYQVSDFRSAEYIAQGGFEIMSKTTPERFDTKFYHKLTLSITKCEKLSKSKVEKRLSKWKENICQ